MHGKHLAWCLAWTKACSFNYCHCLCLTPGLSRSYLPRVLVYQITVNNEEINKKGFRSVIRCLRSLPDSEWCPSLPEPTLVPLTHALDTIPYKEFSTPSLRSKISFRYNITLVEAVQWQARFLISPESISEVSSAQLLWLTGLVTYNIKKKEKEKLSLTRKEENKRQNLPPQSGASRDKSCKHFPLPWELSKKIEARDSGNRAFQIIHRVPS